jgi:hypothetical protein
LLLLGQKIAFDDSTGIYTMRVTRGWPATVTSITIVDRKATAPHSPLLPVFPAVVLLVG